MDQQEIYDLQTRYAMAIDAGRYDDLDEVFLPDVVADYGALGELNGVDAVKAACRDALEPLTVAQHINANHWAQSTATPLAPAATSVSTSTAREHPGASTSPWAVATTTR